MASPTEAGRGGPGTWLQSAPFRVAAAVVLLVVVAALVLVVATRGADDGADGPGPSAEAPSSPVPSATDPTDGPSEEPPREPTPTESPAPEPPATAAPGEGDGEAPVARPTADPVPLEEPARPTPEVEARITRIEAVEGEANLPGEVGGPALRITVSVDNATSAPLDLTFAVVNLYFGQERSPAIELLRPGGEEFPAEVDAGGEATGVFVFLVPEGERDDVLVELDLSTESTVVLFEGVARP